MTQSARLMNQQMSLDMRFPTISYYPGIQFRLPCNTPPPPPQDNFSLLPNCSLGRLNAKQRCPQKNFGMGYVKKCMVSMATHSGFENGGMPAKVLISQLLLILDY